MQRKKKTQRGEEKEVGTEMILQYPEIAVFDLDYTVWPCHCDTHLEPPFKAVVESNGETHTVYDSKGFKLTIYKDIPRILTDLKRKNVTLISASRTWAPDIAMELLRLFKIEYDGKIVSLWGLFDAMEWGERSKVGHINDALRTLYGGTQDIKQYRMCLFDDESRNRDVERYGIKYIHVKDTRKGPSWELYQSYLEGKL